MRSLNKPILLGANRKRAAQPASVMQGPARHWQRALPQSESSKRAKYFGKARCLQVERPGAAPPGFSRRCPPIRQPRCRGRSPKCAQSVARCYAPANARPDAALIRMSPSPAPSRDGPGSSPSANASRLAETIIGVRAWRFSETGSTSVATFQFLSLFNGQFD
jgi:hypothetical protein